MKKIKLLAILFLLLFVVACSSDSDDDDMGPQNPPVDTSVTYAGTIKAIIDDNCISCHKSPPVNSAPMSLLTKENVQDAVTNRGLISNVESGAMPPTGTDLTAAQVKSIKGWQAGGFK
jgi:mono/diheme cytochrome c family protein